VIRGRFGPLTRLGRWYSNLAALGVAAGANDELLVLSGPLYPYPGELGVIELGALSAFLLIEQAEKNIAVIMKDRKIHESTLKS